MPKAHLSEVNAMWSTFPRRWDLILEQRVREQMANPFRGIAPMILVLFFFSLLLGTRQAAAATRVHASPSLNDKNKHPLACKADIERFCSGADLKQECLVARWDRISAECRNILGTSAGSRADGGT
jgi:hypothetical protein